MTEAVTGDCNLKVSFTGAFETHSDRTPVKAGWEVSVMYNGNWAVVSRSKHPFSSRRDAELAMAALVAEGLTDAASLLNAGKPRVHEIMFSALPW